MVRCSRHAATYIPGPPPVEPADVPGSPSRFAKPSASRSPPPNKSPRFVNSPRSTATSNTVISASSPNRSFVSNRQSRVTSAGPSDERVAQSTTSTRSRRGVAQSSPVYNGKSRGTANPVQRQDSSPLTKGTSSALSPKSGGLSRVVTHTGAARGRVKQTLHEVSSRVVQAIFDAQLGETRTVMVVAVFGVRPAAPHHARSLEGYCVIVSDFFEMSKMKLM